MKFLLILILPMVISGYEWASPQLVGTGDKSCFGLDCNNHLWCLFLYNSTLNGAFYDNSQWSDPALIYTGRQATGVGGFDATTAKDGKLWVVTSDEYGGGSPPHITIYYDGSVWSDSFVIIGGTGFRLAADSIGKVWAVFGGFEDWRIWCDVCDDTIWTGPYVVCEHPTQAQVTVPRITVDPEGTRWVSAIIIASGQGLLCRSDSTGAWSDSLIMIPSDLGTPSAIVSDYDGNIWIACNNSENILYAAYLDTNLQWSLYYQITQFNGRCRIAVDNENNVWIVYDKDNTFYYRVWDGIEWSPEQTIVASPASSAFHGDIFYDPVRERIWISFRVSDGFHHHIFTTWTNTAGGVIEHEVQNGKNSLLIYPTPAKDNIFINTQNKEPKNIKIFDCLGRVVKTFITAEKVIIWDCTDNRGKSLKKGIYFIKIITENGSISKKLIIL